MITLFLAFLRSVAKASLALIGFALERLMDCRVLITSFDPDLPFSAALVYMQRNCVRQGTIG